jgi:hypothetical protein
MSFGGSQGTIRYALVVDDAQATTKLNSFKTSLTQLAAPTATVNKNLATMGTNLKGSSATIQQQTTQVNANAAAQQKLGTTINQQTTAQQKLTTTTNQQATSQRKLGDAIKGNFSKFSGLATGMSATASGALQLAAGFRDYSDAQIAVDRSTRKNSLAQEALGKAQAKLQALEKSGKASSAELAAARLDVSQADQQAKIQVQLLGEAQERMFDSQSQFVASVIPTTLGMVGTLGAAFQTLGGNMGKLKGIFPTIKSGLMGLAGSFTSIATSGPAAGAGLTAVGTGGHAAKAGLLGLGLLAATVAAPILAAAAAFETLPKLEEFKKAQQTIDAASATMLAKLKARKLQLEQLLAPPELTKPSSWAATLSRIFGDPKKAKELQIELDAINKVLQAGNKDLKDYNQTEDQYTAKMKAGTLATQQATEPIQTVNQEVAKAGHTWAKVTTLQDDYQLALAETTQKQIDNSAAVKTTGKDYSTFMTLLNEWGADVDKTTTNYAADIDKVLSSTLDLVPGIETQVKEQEQLNQVWRDAHPESLKLNESLLEQAKALGITEEHLARFTPEVGAAEEEINLMNMQLQASAPSFAKMHNDLIFGADNWKLFAEAEAKALTEAGNFLEGISTVRTEQEAWLREINHFIPGVDAMAETLNLTNDQVAQIITTIGEGPDAIEKFNKAFKDFAAEWEKADMFRDFFKIDVGKQTDKIFKDLVKNMPKDVRGKIKADLKVEAKAESLAAAVKEFTRGFISAAEGGEWVMDPQLKVKPRVGIEAAESILKEIDDAFGKKKGGESKAPGAWGRVREGLQAAVDEGGSKGVEMFEALIKGKDWQEVFKIEPIPVTISEASLAGFGDQIFKAIGTLQLAAKLNVEITPDMTMQEVLDDIWWEKQFQNVEPEVAVTPVVAPDVKPLPVDTTVVTATPDPKLTPTSLDAMIASASASPTLPPLPMEAKVTNVIYDPSKVKPGETYEQGGVTYTKGSEEEKAAIAAGEIKGPDGGMGIDTAAAVAGLQTLQKAFQSLATYSIKNMQAMGKAAKTNFNSIANYAKGATTFLQTNQKALNSLAQYGVKNMQALGKASKTHFNSVANYANGATKDIQTLQTALNSLQKHGVKNMQALGKAAKTNFNSVANYANGATTAVNKLSKAIRNMPSPPSGGGFSGGGFNFQHGYHGWVNAPMRFIAGEAGPEYVSVTPKNKMGGASSREGGAMGGSGTLIVNLTNVNSDRETVRTFRRELGKDIYRFGPT